MNARFCVIDYETYSEAPLKSCGAYEYSMHPTTEILCVAWRIGTREELKTAHTRTWAPNVPDLKGYFRELLHALRDPDIILVAHNAFFEQVITRNVFATKIMPSKRSELANIPPERWRCTASYAAALALPRSLEGACAAMNLKVQKDMEGNTLVKKWCKPRKPTLKNPSVRHDDAAELERIIKYCATDVDAEVELFLALPPLHVVEKKVWELDQKINLRGFLVDRPLVSNVLKMIEEETKNLNRETAELSLGLFETANQRGEVLAWLENEGAYFPDLKKKTVEDALKADLVKGDARRMLEIRQAISKTSTAKYAAFDIRSSKVDSRLRDNLLYHGASTGRWAGTGVQPQNFNRGSIKNIDQACDVIAEGDLEMIRLLYGDPMNVFSSCLRGMIVAPPGRTFDVADYASIETRVLFWIARHEAGVKAFIDGRGLYEEMAAKIYNTTADKIGKSSLERQVGKTAILGLGYSMGAKKFHEACLLQNIEISLERAEQAVRVYRETHHPVVKLWDNIGRAAIAAIENPEKKYTINFTTWSVSDGFLWCRLPSGRRLAYASPTVKYEETSWGAKRPTIYHHSQNPMTRKWESGKSYGGKLVENIIQAVSRDIMAWAMLRIEETRKWDIVLSVHDELIAERDLSGSASLAEFVALMEACPPWAVGCPIKAEGWSGRRYKK